MAFAHGSNAVFKVDNSSDVLTDISSYVKSVSFPRTIETAETTTLGKTAKCYIAGLEDATISIEGPFDPTLDALLDGIRRTEVDFEYGPQGSDSGAVKYTGKCILTSYEATTGVDGVGSYSAEFQVTDAITRSTYA